MLCPPLKFFVPVLPPLLVTASAVTDGEESKYIVQKSYEYMTKKFASMFAYRDILFKF
jgi:hypothetical protein